jgi:hypothetical protein
MPPEHGRESLPVAEPNHVGVTTHPIAVNRRQP